MNWTLAIGAAMIGGGWLLWRNREHPAVLAFKENVTQKLTPAPIDVDEEPPPGSHIVGKQSINANGKKTSAEFNRITNLTRRWARVNARAADSKGFPPTAQFQKAFSRWQSFMTDRTQRSMVNWEHQFRDLELYEDWTALHHPGWFPIRDDWSVYDDATYAAMVKTREQGV